MLIKKNRTLAMLTVCMAVAASIGTASADWVTATVAAGTNPYAVAVNPVTNKVYVANIYSNNVTVIDGATNATTTVATDSEPHAVAVNPATNKIYVANFNNASVTVIDGTTNDTTTVPAGTGPFAVAVNPVTNKIYVANIFGSASVTVIDGATNGTTTVPAGEIPTDVAVNPVTNRIYVVNYLNYTVTVIDGATNDTTTVTTEGHPNGVAVNPVTNKIYVAQSGNSNVTVIDGATNDTTTVPTGDTPYALAVNPVTNKTYVANQYGNSVTVITDVSANDTKVRAVFNRLPGDTTALARPTLTGKGVNRSIPGRTPMMGICNRVGSAQKAWSWATVNSGAGTDSITWSYAWGTDSLIAGENFICCVPLEAQAATTNNLGLGSPFAGNLEVYPVYRIVPHVGQQEAAGPEVRITKLPTIVRGVLFMEARGEKREARSELLDISGRMVLALHPGPNDVSRLAPGVYFVCPASGVEREASDVTKVVLTK